MNFVCMLPNDALTTGGFALRYSVTINEIPWPGAGECSHCKCFKAIQNQPNQWEAMYTLPADIGTTEVLRDGDYVYAGNAVLSDTDPNPMSNSGCWGADVT